MLTIAVFAAFAATGADTIKLKSGPDLEKNILEYVAPNAKGQPALTEDILLVDSRGEISKGPILLPKGSIWRTEEEAKRDFQLTEWPTKKAK